MNEIDDGSIDLILTDPPYGINFRSNRRNGRHSLITNDDNLYWLVPFLKECKRVMKPDAHAYIFISHHHIDVVLLEIKKYLSFKSILVWNKNHFGMGDLRGDYAPQYEFIIFCSNGKRKLNGRRTSNVLNFKRTGNKLHPTEKPVDLFEFLMSKSSKVGDIVLDPFAGSGTTGVACRNIIRNFILIEKDNAHYEILTRRID